MLEGCWTEAGRQPNMTIHKHTYTHAHMCVYIDINGHIYIYIVYKHSYCVAYVTLYMCLLCDSFVRMTHTTPHECNYVSDG